MSQSQDIHKNPGNRTWQDQYSLTELRWPTIIVLRYPVRKNLGLRSSQALTWSRCNKSQLSLPENVPRSGYSEESWEQDLLRCPTVRILTRILETRLVRINAHWQNYVDPEIVLRLSCLRESRSLEFPGFIMMQIYHNFDHVFIPGLSWDIPRLSWE
jgi:hypothetical protein